MTWLNNDGLEIRFGREEATVGKGGEYRTNGPQRWIEFAIDATSITSSPAIVDKNLFVPAGFKVESVDVIATTACTSGGSAALNVGLIRYDQSTELDYDGLVAALALTALDATGETSVLTKGSTGAGALVGTTVGSNPGYLTVDYDTAAYTAGRIKVRVKLAKEVA